MGGISCAWEPTGPTKDCFPIYLGVCHPPWGFELDRGNGVWSLSDSRSRCVVPTLRQTHSVGVEYSLIPLSWGSIATHPETFPTSTGKNLLLYSSLENSQTSWVLNWAWVSQISVGVLVVFRSPSRVVPLTNKTHKRNYEKLLRTTKNWIRLRFSTIFEDEILLREGWRILLGLLLVITSSNLN